MLKSIVVLSYFWLCAAVLSPLAVLYMLIDFIGLGRPFRPALGAGTRALAKSILWAVGARTTVTGLENVPDDDRLCFVANHQGDLDIILIMAFMPRPVGFIAKSEAAWFPFVNLWIAALGSSFINRKSPRQGKKAIDRGVRSIERGHAMVIYPEGTRSRGPSMLPFHKGAFKLATRPGATIVPVTIDGAYKVWELHNRIESADVRIVVHPPIRTAGLDPDQKRAVPGLVEAAIASGLPGDA
ncbi:MAG: 1-acyl-sn-glycerol-3-phosphate acyltransferase [Spirochaetae bacterium HGW-Spirochaetae-3]|jgi:1-acyl-sn-glycerol-3-phosphate acyltransferase|nr:MAG: 1-acyl-sn-glycerol-3-phosphate acyltransferase [Spirochaetae bacterium HGW-Spirochaetae-3]